MPLVMREFATFSRSDSRQIFRTAPRELRRSWGVLHCVDAAGVKWTALGDPDYTRSLQAAEVPHEPIPGYDHGANWNRMGAPPTFREEWPLAAFAARWAVRGWPDECGVIDRPLAPIDDDRAPRTSTVARDSKASKRPCGSSTR